MGQICDHSNHCTNDGRVCFKCSNSTVTMQESTNRNPVTSSKLYTSKQYRI